MVENTKIEDCEKVMNFFTNHEEKVGHKLKIPDCCDNSRNVHYITCENGYITAMDVRMNKFDEQIDFSNFPLLPNLRKLVFEGHLFKDGVLPSRFFDIPKLEDLEIMSSNLKSIPENINTNCPLTKLSIYNNTVVGFPYQILKFKKLKYLNLSRNEGIEIIPEGINNLENLETLYIGVTGLKSMHENIFDLKNLKDFDLDGNPDLKTRILNFGKPLDSCDLRNVNIECYQSGTCEKIIVEEKPFRKYNYDVDSSFKICTDVTRATTHTNSLIDFDAPDENNTKLIILSSIIGSIVILLSILLCYFKLKSNKKKIKNYNEDDKIQCISNDMNYDMLDDSMMDNSSFDDFDTSKLPLTNLNSERVTSTYLSGYNVESTAITPSEFNEKIPNKPISLSVPSLSTSFNLNLSDVNSTANLNELPFPYQGAIPYQGASLLNSNNSVISNNKNVPSYIDNMSQINNISNDNDFPITLIQPLQNTYLMVNNNNFNMNNNFINVDSNSSIATVNTNANANGFQYNIPQSIQNSDFNNNNNNNNINNSNKILPSTFSMTSKMDTNFDVISVNSTENNNNNNINIYTNNVVQVETSCKNDNNIINNNDINNNNVTNTNTNTNNAVQVEISCKNDTNNINNNVTNVNTNNIVQPGASNKNDDNNNNIIINTNNEVQLEASNRNDKNDNNDDNNNKNNKSDDNSNKDEKDNDNDNTNNDNDNTNNDNESTYVNKNNDDSNTTNSNDENINNSSKQFKHTKNSNQNLIIDSTLKPKSSFSDNNNNSISLIQSLASNDIIMNEEDILKSPPLSPESSVFD